MRIPSRRSAFTLLELMIVLVIISLLGAAFLVVSGRALGRGVEQKAKARLQQLAVMVEQFRQTEGEYPNDRLPSSVTGNGINVGSEALYLALFDADYHGESPNQEWLVNTDADQTARNLTRLLSRELFEIGDPWGNPIAYFESLHYEDSRAVPYYAAPEDEEPFEQLVAPSRNERTGGWEQEGRFQLVSAGADGEFGTEDDLFHYR